MEIIMRKWYAFLSGKKMLGIGLGAVVALTALLAVNFYREQNDRYVTTNGSEALTQAEQANKTQSASAHDKPTDLDPTAQHITLISFCLADSFTAFTNLFVVTPDTQHNKILYILYYLTF